MRQSCAGSHLTSARERTSKRRRRCNLLVPVFQSNRIATLTLFAALFGIAGAQTRNDPLPSWNNGPAKQAILSFVKETTSQSSPKYVEPRDRIATFDQDGTLWTEHPLYAQGVFALERVGKLAPGASGMEDEAAFPVHPQS